MLFQGEFDGHINKAREAAHVANATHTRDSMIHVHVLVGPGQLCWHNF